MCFFPCSDTIRKKMTSIMFEEAKKKAATPAKKPTARNLTPSSSNNPASPVVNLYPKVPSPDCRKACSISDETHQVVCWTW